MAGTQRVAPWFVVMSVALALCLILGLAVGSGDASLLVAVTDPGSIDRDIILGLRLPRVVLGAIAGSGLAAVGVVFQAVLRNPLAEPYVLGVSGGAALGATLAILAGLGGVAFLQTGRSAPTDDDPAVDEQPDVPAFTPTGGRRGS